MIEWVELFRYFDSILSLTNNIIKSKRYIHSALTLILLLFSPLVKGQLVTVEDLLKVKPVLASRVTPKTEDPGQIILRMEFGRSEIINKTDIKKLKNQVIVQIDLVYTSYQKTESFNQPELNAKRLKTLQKLIPNLFESNLIEWQFIAQSSCKGQNCHKMFHGFIIHTSYSSQSNYKLTYENLNRKDEVALVDKYFGANSIQSSPQKMSCDTIVHELDSLGLFIPVSRRKQELGLRYDKKGIWKRQQEKILYQRLEIKNCQDISSLEMASINIDKWTNDGLDAAVINTLSTLDNNKAYTIVQDVTMSMYPYSIQALYWHYHMKDSVTIKNWIVFNDGDKTPDKAKKVGKTGGIYQVSETGLDSVNQTILKAMNAGDGGGLPENDIEAVIFAQQFYPNSELILIADNFSNCRDFGLHKSIQGKLHIILCGAEYFINEQYIKLAIELNGNLYTNHGVYRNMGQFKNGQVFQVGNRNFSYRNNHLKIIWT